MRLEYFDGRPFCIFFCTLLCIASKKIYAMIVVSGNPVFIYCFYKHANTKYAVSLPDHFRKEADAFVLLIANTLLVPILILLLLITAALRWFASDTALCS